MSNLVKVEQVYFDTDSKQPVFYLEDGTQRVVHLVATGNCWVEYWVTPEERRASIERVEKAEREWKERATPAKPKQTKRFKFLW